MADSTVDPKPTKAKRASTRAKAPAAEAAAAGTEPAKARFAKAVEEVRAGAQAMGRDAQGRAEVYREKAVATGGELLEEAKVMGEQAKVRAAELANEGKTKASDAISSLGQVVADTAATIDEKLGPKYGDYARTAARSMQETAAKLEAKEIGELGEDAKEFVRKSPGVALGVAAVAGFMLARFFRKSED